MKLVNATLLAAVLVTVHLSLLADPNDSSLERTQETADNSRDQAENERELDRTRMECDAWADVERCFFGP